MKIKYVTLTGADDDTSIPGMVELSREYPFAEWAILFSQSKANVPRYPGQSWVKELLATKGLPFVAAHLCGKWVDDAMGGRVTFIDPFGRNIFHRIQLNMSRDRLARGLRNESLRAAVANCVVPVVMGGNYRNVRFTHEDIVGMGASPLFDSSGGRGVLADEWPEPVLSNGRVLFCGYAGGLGPDNVVGELDRIASLESFRANPDAEVWIDMETGVRKNDAFDLGKCGRVLAAVKVWSGG